MREEATAGEIVVVTGMTGAGRSTAAKELEDLGFYVVDNLPPSLVSEVVRLVDEGRGVDHPIAVVVDVRSGSFFETLPADLARSAEARSDDAWPAYDALVPRGQRRCARPTAGGGSPPAPTPGRWPVAGWAPARTRGDRYLAGQCRSVDRHDKPQRAPIDGPGPRGVRHADHHPAEDPTREFRFQVRHPRRLRLRRGHAVPSQSVTGSRSCVS